MSGLTTTNSAAIAAAVEGALAHQRAGRLGEAEAILRKVLQAQPDNPDATHFIGLLAYQRGEFDRAIELINRSVMLDPANPTYFSNLGEVYRAVGKIERSMAACRKAIAIKPDHVNGHINLGNALKTTGDLSEAAAAYSRAIEYMPGNADAHNNLGGTLQDLGRHHEAIECFRAALERNPDHPVAYGNFLLGLNYMPDLEQAGVFAEHRAWAARHAAPLSRAAAPHQNTALPDRRLRVGFVSPDLHTHSVAYFLEPLLADRTGDEFEAVCYADVAVPDETTGRLERSADLWRNIYGAKDEDVAGMVRDDAIDVLVDLSGHTRGNRLMVFARRPAPVQISYIGYCNTTGLDCMDGRLSDAIADPEGQDGFHSERLIRLPGCFLCYRPIDEAPPVGPAPAASTGEVRFGSFNNLTKISPAVIAAWADILNAVPDARLLLKATALVDQPTRERFAAAFEQAGIARERIELVAKIHDKLEHLALYSSIDIALDPFPYNGTTTTCEALWMGVPVITLAGDRHAGRVGASLLSAVGLDELIAPAANDYVATAVALAGDPGRIAALRSTLRQRTAGSPLCDSRRLVAAVESALRTLWRAWCAGREERQ